VLLSSGCSSEDSPATTDAASDVAFGDATRTDPECEAIAQACHLYDKGADSGVAHTCHDACLAACGGDAGGADSAASD
jgi:hypothetical protein